MHVGNDASRSASNYPEFKWFSLTESDTQCKRKKVHCPGYRDETSTSFRIETPLTIATHVKKSNRRKPENKESPTSPHESEIMQELSLLQVDPARLFVSQEFFQRIRKFLCNHVNTDFRHHPFLQTAVAVSVVHAPLMSSKILNASLWDDVNGPSGQITRITQCQRQITMSLLAESLSNGNESLSDSTIATLEGLIIYELIDGNLDFLQKYMEQLEEMIYQRGGLDALGFDGHMKNTVLVIWELQRVIQALAGFGSVIEPTPAIAEVVCQPLNLRLFTFQNEMNMAPEMSLLLGNFFGIITLPIHYEVNPQARQHFDHQWGLLHAYFLTLKNNNNLNNYPDPRAPVIIEAALLFATYTDRKFVLDEKSYPAFQELLRKTDISKLWCGLPGALVWCLVIGVRCSASNTWLRRWLLVQLTQVAWPLAIDTPDDVLTSFRLVLKGLDARGPSSSYMGESRFIEI
ncbi:hypothetical protein BGW36DRAFT_362368 [Talaromyces proteolyticus]|uniref:Uncharacterized protein n=1 Tax=Talaromyces proteolyticus TaxID=1131652 RepID=A0AAD4PT79_9EURO|nr:uncharacterized protein BGW36DRAFT_362368 [Talaromyces proteolyticus]KAH8692820.1 hypothetical protein BGW36DRAFT_362368 [Talaromyces proteolyticus]